MSIRSGKWQLNAIGIFLIALFAGISWWICRKPISFSTAIPLACMAYAAGNIIFELTINRANVPTVATSLTTQRRITRIIVEDAEKRASSTYKIVDLGSGRGEFVRRIAKAVPKAQVEGVEIARLPYLQSQLIRKLFGPANTTYTNLDFWSYDSKPADVVLLYLSARLAQEVGAKLYGELRQGSLVISGNFPLLGPWGEPTEKIELRTPFKETIFVYRKG